MQGFFPNVCVHYFGWLCMFTCDNKGSVVDTALPWGSVWAWGFLVKPTIGMNSQRSGGAQRSDCFFCLFISCCFFKGMWRSQETGNFPPGHFSLFPLNECWALSEFDWFNWSSFKILTVVYFPQRRAPRLMGFSLWHSLTSTWVIFLFTDWRKERKNKTAFDLLLYGVAWGAVCWEKVREYFKKMTLTHAWLSLLTSLVADGAELGGLNWRGGATPPSPAIKCLTWHGR